MVNREICVVGAGMAGAGVAYALSEADADATVTVFEKGDGVGGRTATHRRRDCVYDVGANYVKGDDRRTAELAREAAAARDGDGDGDDPLVTFDDPVWTFDADGAVAESDRRDEKLAWRGGIARFAEGLFDATDADVRTGVRIAGLAARAGDSDANADADVGSPTWTWTPTDADGDERGAFDEVVLTPPAPRTAALLRATDWPDDDGATEAMRTAAAAVPYRIQRTVVLHYPFELDRPYYALVNADKDHAVWWCSREECKPGRVPDGESLLIAQMSPGWSAERFDEPLDDVAADAAARVASVFGDDRLRAPDWTDGARWRHALPEAEADADALARGRTAGLRVAGDWCVGEGRVHAALRSGIETGERIARDAAGER